MTNIELISFVASLASLILAIVAILLSFHQKKETDAVNEKTKTLLLEVHSDAKTISAVAMPELKKYGEAMRKFVFKEQSSSESESLREAIRHMREEIAQIKNFNGLTKEMEEKLDDLTSTISDEIEPNVSSSIGYVTIDGSEVGLYQIAAPIHQFETVQDLLDMIWISMLSDSVPSYSYGKTWYIYDRTQSKKLMTKGSGDNRSLNELGVTDSSILEIHFT
ncbi:hypothetical protein [Vibrio harveyi]|uniref:hypothetical protein n=1 Tax=Vibrio harveyi TaxID=669 RepID=UPI003BB80515